MVDDRTARLSKAEVRARVLDRAIGIIDREGVRMSVSHLRLEDLIRDAGVPRSTVYRVWPSRQDFYDELIAAVPNRTLSGRLDKNALETGDSYVHRRAPELATAEGRHAVQLEAIAIAVQANYDNTFASVPWRNFIAVAASIDSHEDPTTRSAIEKALRSRQLHFIDNMAKYYEHVFLELGQRLRPSVGADFRQFASVLAAYIEGLCVARLVVPELVTGPIRAGGPELHNLAVVGFTALYEAFSEPLPSG
jgi:AcrR family transcriptional regulator